MLCTFTQAHNLQFQSIISRRRHSIMYDLEAEKRSLHTSLNTVLVFQGSIFKCFHESYRAQGYSLINSCYKNINNSHSQEYLNRLTPPFILKLHFLLFFLFRRGRLRVFLQRMGFGEHEELNFFVEHVLNFSSGS